MSETTNYGLYLEDDASAKFQTWRQKMNGSGPVSYTHLTQPTKLEV